MNPPHLEELVQCLGDWRAELATSNQPKEDVAYGVCIADTVERFIATLRCNDLQAAKKELDFYAYQGGDTYLAPTVASRAVDAAVGRVVRELPYLG